MAAKQKDSPSNVKHKGLPSPRLAWPIVVTSSLSALVAVFICYELIQLMKSISIRSNRGYSAFFERHVIMGLKHLRYSDPLSYKRAAKLSVFLRDLSCPQGYMYELTLHKSPPSLHSISWTIWNPSLSYIFTFGSSRLDSK